ncbi:hypothetical protein GCM10007894_23090 [Paraferrimonas haliotis]|uniref:N-acetyltransferase domain-containing protein n=1 Tax=Paraferrimonas haliotis TaxID=2013866 RepID=A0AA37WXF8_9GAMM|nr:hypothetical protein GCM10007894_23090 [Paraferrimonas haliotis]
MGVVRYVPINEVWLLRGLVIAPDYRNLGLASKLVIKSREQHLPCYLFCDRTLVDFYKRCGFELCQAEGLPSGLLQRFCGYKARQPKLVAMACFS